MERRVSAYQQIVEFLKDRIRKSRINAVLTANVELLALYWEIGHTISIQEEREGWGAKTVEQLSKDLRKEFPDFKGLSPRNLRYMRDFSVAWPELSILQQAAAKMDAGSILQQPVAKLPWGHNCLILDKLKNKEERVFYAEKAVEHGWSRNVMSHQIESGLYRRIGKLPNNFSSTLPGAHSDLARELFKDPYKFDFLQLSADAHERDLEDALMTHLSNFLLEMGRGFSFVGRQVHFEQGGRDYYIDLLLYHFKLHCFVVIELKVGDFRPEYTGKMSFYLSLIDDKLKTEKDKPSIGLVLCKGKDNVTVEYALRDVLKPIGVADYEVNFTKAIPDELKGELPTIEDLESELQKEVSIPASQVTEKIEKLKSYMKNLGKLEDPDALNGAKDGLFNNVILTLLNKLEVILQEVKGIFQSSSIMPMRNGDITSDLLDAAHALLGKPKNDRIESIGLIVSFEGFKARNANAFKASFMLTFSFGNLSYSIGPDNPRKEIWLEKRYDEDWSEAALDALAERWAMWIIDAIHDDVAKSRG